MLKFLVFDQGKPAKEWPLRNAHMLGADDVGIRSSITFKEGLITCEKRTVGPAALSLQYPCGELGELTLQTCLLPDREKPYLLTLELARQRIMKIIAKQEDWALFDLSPEHTAMKRLYLAKQLFVEALNRIDDLGAADRLSRECLSASIDAAEELALAHAELLIRARLQAGQLRRNVFGCGVGIEQPIEQIGPPLRQHFDYITLPTRWREIEPQEEHFNWDRIDRWAEWSYKQRLPIVAGPVLSFHPNHVPDWLYIWEHDYETIRDLIYEHVERLVTRYKNVTTLWNVVSGLHVNATFSFNFEQLMDLTRMAVILTKKIQPNAKTLIEITNPFGEYYSTNQRSIPPLVYADMAVQAGIPFDGFGVKILMGQPADGQYTRDLMHISSVIDKFNVLGKPVHVTGVSVPSESIAAGGHKPIAIDPDNPPTIPTSHSCGYWRKPWSNLVQGHWLEAFYTIALSKPFVESVSWCDLSDHGKMDMPHGGLAMDNLQVKSAFHRIIGLRKALQEYGKPKSPSQQPAGRAQ